MLILLPCPLFFIMELQYTKLAKSCINDLIDDAADNIKKLQRLISDYKIVFEGPFNLDEKGDQGKSVVDPLNMATGVYQIVYRPTKVIYYIGKGVITGRKNRHQLVFRNDGNPINRNRCVTDSQVARKMYEKDSDLSNWDFWYTRIPESDVMTIFEEVLIKKIEPEFNTLSMAGKG